MFPGTFPPVIMLHHVTDDVSLDALKPYSISHQSFVRLLDVLTEDGYRATGFEDLDYVRGKRVIITFDDCPKHLWDFAIPELLKRGMKAVFYMPTAYLGGVNDWDVIQGKPSVPLMDETDIKRLVDSGMEVGSHSHFHKVLGKESEQEVKENLVQSKQILEKITGKHVISIAFPFGSIPENHKRILPDTGYAYGLSIYSPFESRYSLRRWIYHDGDDSVRIRQKLSYKYKLMRIIKDKLSKN